MVALALSAGLFFCLNAVSDEIVFPPPRPPVYDALGGAGAFAALGARIMSPPPDSKSVAWIVDQGSDFPESLTTFINTWDSGVLFRRDDSRLTTRGWNGYGEAEARAFKYTTPKKRLTGNDLTPPMLQSRSFHMVCSPARCRELVAEITLLRKACSPPGSYTKPLFIWEPVPDLCTPEELLECTRTLSCVDICSPNHAELASYMGGSGLDEDGNISLEAVQRNCDQLLSSMPLQSFTLVVRAGHKGCYIANNGGRRSDATRKQKGSTKRAKGLPHGGLQHDTDMFALFADAALGEDGQVVREETTIDAGLSRWIPAVHTDSSKAVDPTGGGNCFLGGLAVALARGCGVEEAAIWGSVAASFAIEQVGMPLVSQAANGAEMWNGVKVDDRMREFKARCIT